MFICCASRCYICTRNKHTTSLQRCHPMEEQPKRDDIYCTHEKSEANWIPNQKRNERVRICILCVCCVLCAVYSLHTQYYSRRTPVIVHLTESNRIQSNTRRIFSIVSRMLHARQTLGVVMMTVSTSYTFRRDLLWHQNMPHFQKYILYAFCFIT